MPPLPPGLQPQYADLWNFYQQQIQRGMVQPSQVPIDWFSIHPSVQQEVMSHLTQGTLNPGIYQAFMTESQRLASQPPSGPVTPPGGQPGIPPVGGQPPIGGNPAGNPGYQYPQPPSGLAPVLDQFVEGNWDVLYPAMMPQGGASAFSQWLRSQSNRYMGEYQGVLGQEALGNNIPSTTGQQFLSSLFGGTPMGQPFGATFDYLSTSPFNRGERPDRVQPLRSR